MKTTILKIQHAEAVKKGDRTGMLEIEKELEGFDIYCLWLSDDVLVWKSKKELPRKKSQKPDGSIDESRFYAGSSCSRCGGPVEKTGKPGRPPTLCIKHRR